MRKHLCRIAIWAIALTGTVPIKAATSIGQPVAEPLSSVPALMRPRPNTVPGGAIVTEAKSTATKAPMLPAAEADAPQLFGALVSTSEAATIAKAYGIYSFPASSDITFTAINTEPNYLANGGGVYINGKYYFVSWFESFGAVFAYFRIADADTWEMLQSARADISSVATDMTYDPVSETIYGCYLDATGSGYLFGHMSMIDGSVTPICYLDAPFFAIASDASGNLYAISSTGDFCSVDKETGKQTRIGATGLRPAYTQSMTFDMASGRLFWAACTTTKNGLYEIDVTTGKATLVGDFVGNEEFAGLFSRSSGAISSAPGALTGFTADYDIATSSDVKVSFTMPETTFGGTPVSGKTEWIISLNDVNAEIGEAMPGEQVNVTLRNAPVGMNTISAFARNSAGKGPQEKVRKWIGVDTPMPLENVVVTAQGNKAIVKWDAPTKSLHDGYFNPADLNYRVVRQPGNITVCQKTTETTFTDELDISRLGSYSYDIITYVGSVRGETTSSNKLVIGEAFDVPFKETFDNADDFGLYTIIDANNDGRTWSLDDNRAKGTYSISNPMNDWLITPPIKFDKGYIYTLRFKVSTMSFKEKFRVAFGTAPTVEGMDLEILPEQQVKNSQPLEFTVRFTPTATGTGFVGFHHCSDRECHNLYLDDIEIVQTASVKVPAAISDITVTPADKGALKCSVSFHAPTKNVAGEDITSLSRVLLYHGNQIVASFSNPQPGELLTKTDIECIQGQNTFKAVASNADGSGLETSVTAFIGPDVPGRCHKIRVVENNGKAVLTWEGPAEGINGGYVDPEGLRYFVARQNYVNGGVEAVATNLTECRFEEVPPIEGQQGIVAYYVYAGNERGIGDGYLSNVIIMGTPYSLPFKESFSSAMPSYACWRMETSDESSTWGVTSVGTYPTTEPYDGDGGLISYAPGVADSWSILTSGKISLKEASHPVAEFHYYHKNRSTDVIKLMVSDNGVDYSAVETVDMGVISEFSGWRKVSVPLDAYAGKDFIQLGFRVDCGDDLTGIHIDNIVVREVADKDLALTMLEGPSKFEAGKPGLFRMTVANMGAAVAEYFTVNLMRDGKDVASVNGRNLAAGTERVYEVTVTPDVSHPDVAVYRARVDFMGDTNMANNLSDDLKVIVSRPAFPAVEDLAGTFDGQSGTVNLFWSAPDMTAAPRVTDDFENYNPFLISGFGDWMTVDVDNQSTIYFQNVPLWPNCTMPQAFIVFNPKKAGLDPDNNPDDGMFETYSGDQMLISFASSAPNNDDWLISPRLSGNAQDISFMICSLTTYSGPETYEFYVCDGDFRESISDFRLLPDVGGEVGEAWEKVTVSLPEGVRYFAIRCTSADKWGLCIDDVTYTPAAAENLELRGYDVYCNGTKLNDAPLTETSFTHTGVDASKQYSYNVVCVYDLGRSNPSNEFVAGSGGIASVEGDNVTVRTLPGEIVISGAAGEEYSVANVAGVVSEAGNAAAEQHVSVASGFYIVSVGNRTYKLHVK